MNDYIKGFATRAIHAGHTPDSDTHSRAVPLYQTTSYTFEDTNHAADLFGLRKFGNIYTRIMNPHQLDAFEQRMAALEGGVGALATASGQAAETLAILTLAQAGDEIVSSTDLYGGTVSLFAHTLKKLGITVRFVQPGDFNGWEQAINEKTKALYVESIGNPKLDILDIEKIATIGKAAGRTPDRGQHGDDALSAAALRARSRHCRSLGNQIHRRARYLHRRRHRGFRPVRLGRFRSVRLFSGTGPGLPRP